MATPGAHLDSCVHYPTLKAGGQDVAQHDQRFFVRAVGNRVQAGVGMWNPHTLSLRASDTVARYPAARGAVRVSSRSIVPRAPHKRAGDDFGGADGGSGIGL